MVGKRAEQHALLEPFVVPSAEGSVDRGPS